MMRRLQRDLENASGFSSGARLLADEPYNAPAPAKTETRTAAAPAPLRQPVVQRPAPIVARPAPAPGDDWSAPRPSRTGIAPAPAGAPPESMHAWLEQMSPAEIRDYARGDSGRSSHMLVDTLRLAQRYCSAGIASAVASLKDRIAR